jgi:hypothetical protein
MLAAQEELLRGMVMQRVLVIALLAATVALPAVAQETPHDFKQDTPPVPGQVVQHPRDELRIVPLPMRDATLENTGLPVSGQMGVARGPRSERLYRPPVR